MGEEKEVKILLTQIQINETLEVYVFKVRAKISHLTPLTIEILSKIRALNERYLKAAMFSEILRETRLNSMLFNKHLISLTRMNLIEEERRGSNRLFKITNQGKKVVDYLPSELTQYDNIKQNHRY